MIITFNKLPIKNNYKKIMLGSFILKISGVYSAALTPIKEDLSVNKDLYLRHCQYLMKQGHDGLAIFGTTFTPPKLAHRELFLLVFIFFSMFRWILIEPPLDMYLKVLNTLFED